MESNKLVLRAKVNRSMAKTRKQKENTVGILKENFEKSTSVVMADYHGLSVSAMAELKKELKSVGGTVTVAKNTLVQRASESAGAAIDPENLQGPTAIIFSLSDPIEPIKKLYEFIKSYELPRVRAGLFEGRQITAEDVVALSKIPSKQELYAKVVGSLNSPIYGIVSVLGANLRNLVYVLDQVKNQKES